MNTISVTIEDTTDAPFLQLRIEHSNVSVSVQVTPREAIDLASKLEALADQLHQRCASKHPMSRHLIAT
jgi:hypothetical protein